MFTTPTTIHARTPWKEHTHSQAQAVLLEYVFPLCVKPQPTRTRDIRTRDARRGPRCAQADRLQQRRKKGESERAEEEGRGTRYAKHHTRVCCARVAYVCGAATRRRLWCVVRWREARASIIFNPIGRGAPVCVWWWCWTCPKSSVWLCAVCKRQAPLCCVVLAGLPARCDCGGSRLMPLPRDGTNTTAPGRAICGSVLGLRVWSWRRSGAGELERAPSFVWSKERARAPTIYIGPQCCQSVKF